MWDEEATSHCQGKDWPIEWWEERPANQEAVVRANGGSDAYLIPLWEKTYQGLSDDSLKTDNGLGQEQWLL